jgi:hypothetical protein
MQYNEAPVGQGAQLPDEKPKGGKMPRLKKCNLIPVFLFISLFLSGAIPLTVSAAPNIMNYQGTLLDDAGNPVTATKTMVFRIYPAIDTAPASALWNSGSVQVQVSEGRFSVNLGQTPQPTFPTNLFDNDTRYMGIAVDGTELPERKRLVSVPYALSGGIPKGLITMWSGSVATIPSGWALCNGQNGTPDLRDKFIVGAGNSYSVGEKKDNGTINLSHTHTTQNHTLTIDEIPSHSHDYSDMYYSEALAGKGSYIGSNETDYDNNPWNYQIGRSTGNRGGNLPHNHGATTLYENPAQDIRPPYFALCFIMKL